MDRQATQSLPSAFIAGALIGVLGGMIGLGGAEFRLPLLIGVFGFVALQAVIMSKAMSLIVVLTTLSARLFSVQWSDVAPHWFVAANLLAGSLVWAWGGVAWATRMRGDRRSAIGDPVSGAGCAAGCNRGCADRGTRGADGRGRW